MNKKQYVLIIILVALSALTGALASSGIARAQSSRSQQTMLTTPAAAQKWEYVLMSGTPGEVDKQLRDAGATSWEVVGLTATEVEGSKQRVVVILRHPKP